LNDRNSRKNVVLEKEDFAAGLHNAHVLDVCSAREWP